MSIHFGQYTTQPRQLLLKEDEKISRNLKPSEPTVVSVEPGDKFEQREKNYESLLKELKGIVSDMYHPKDINEKRIVVLYLNKILQCDDVPDMMSDLWIDMVEKYQAELDKNDAENGTVTPSFGEDTGIQAKKDELEAKRAEKQKLETEIQNLYKQIGPKYTYDDFKKDVENLGKQIGAIEKEIMDLEAEIAEYEAAHSEDTSTGGGLVEEVSDEAFDIDGNKVGETILLKDSSGNVISEKNVQYDKSGNIISEASIKRDDKGNISSEERVKYENGKPSGYTVINYERDEEGRVTTSNSVELDKNHTKVGSRKTEFTYDEEGNVASSTYTHYDRSGKKTSSTTDKYETYTNANGSGGTRSASRSSEYYDDDGNFTGMSKVEYGYDEAGNQISEETTYYDSNTKEVGGTIVTYDADHSVTARKTVSFDRDDADNIREKRVVDTIDPNSGMATHGTTEYFDEVGNKTGSDEFTVETNELGYPVTETRVKFNESGVKVSESNTEYDSEGRNTYNKIVNFDEAGNQTGSTEFKQVFREDGQLDSQTVIEYDADGNVVTTSTVKCEYDKNGKVLSENFVTTNKDGVEIDSATNSYRYDAGGNVTRMEKFESKKDENGKLLTEKTTIYDGDNNKLLEDTYRYNEYGVIVGGESVKYDGEGNVTGSSKFEVELHELGFELSRTIENYDKEGTVVSTSTITVQRDEENNEVSRTEVIVEYENEKPVSEKTIVTDPDGNKISETRAKYDEAGNKSEIHTDVKETTYRVQINGKWVDCKLEIATEKDADGNVISETKTYYDDQGEISSTNKNEYENGVRVKNTHYDAVSGTDGGRQFETTEVTYYDETGEKEVSRTSESRYRDNGNLYKTSNIEYYEDGKPKNLDITFYNPEGGIQSHKVYNYDKKGNETSSVDEYENGKITKTTIISKDGDQKKTLDLIIYGEDEKPVSKSHVDYKDGKKFSTTFEEYTYTDDGVTVKRTVSDSRDKVVSVETVHYDAGFDATVGTSVDPEADEPSVDESVVTNTTTEVEEEDLGSATRTVTTEKDEAGNIVSEKIVITDKESNEITQEITTKYTRDARGNLLSVLEINSTPNNGQVHTKTTKYERDAQGNLLSEIEKHTNNIDDNYTEKITSYKRDAQGNLLSKSGETHNQSGEVYSKFSEDYENEKLVKSYSYGLDDKFNRVEKTVYYDENGNVTQQIDEKHDNKGKFSYKHVTNNSYSNNGNIQSSTVTSYDADGNVTRESTKFFDQDGKEITKTPKTDIAKNDARYTVETKESTYYDGNLGGACKKETITQKDKATGNVVAEKVVYYDALGNEVRYTLTEYNANGKISKVTDYNNEPRTFGEQYSTTKVSIYDEDGNKLYESNEKQYKEAYRKETTEVEYYPNGQVKSKSVNGKITFFNEDGTVRT